MTIQDVEPEFSAADRDRSSSYEIQQAFMALRSEENLAAGIAAGAVASALAAILWAAVSATTGFQIGWMAVGVGLAVGFSVRVFGKGFSASFGLAGATLAFLGSALGNLLTVVSLVAKDKGLSVFQVLSVLDFQISVELMTATFSPIDLVFYAIATYEGYRLSFRQSGDVDLAHLLLQREDDI